MKKKKHHHLSKFYNDNNDAPVIFTGDSDLTNKNFFQVGSDLKMNKVDDQNIIKKKKVIDNLLIAKSLNIGYYLITPLLAGVFIGFWIDKVFKTKPLFFLLLFTLGIVGSFYNLWKIVQESK